MITNSALCDDLCQLFPNWISKSKNFLKTGAEGDSAQEAEATTPPPLLEFKSEEPNSEKAQQFWKYCRRPNIHTY